MRRRAWLKIAAALAAIVLVGTLSIEGIIVASVRSYSRAAMEQFSGDPVEALIRQVECSKCALRDRNHAVWALGQMCDRRALPALRRQVTGRGCDHQIALCQYELNKAIDHLENGILQAIRRAGMLTTGL
jgi:hypothetical protein